MISTNTLSAFILHHHLNRLGNKNLRKIQEIMRASKPATESYKKVCEDFPNLEILTMIATPGKVQLTFGHAAVGNNYLGESIVVFALAGYLSSPSVVSLNIDIAFAADGDKICLPIAKVLLHADAGDLVQSKKQQEWTPRNAVLLPPFLTEAAILQRELDAGKLQKMVARSITEWAKEGETTSGEDNDNDEDIKISVEAKDEKMTKTGKAKKATAETFTTIADDCDDVLAFLNSIIVKSPRAIAAPISLRTENRVHLVPSLERRQPPNANQAGCTRPHWSYGRPDQRGKPVAHQRIAPPRCRCQEQGGKGNQVVEPSSASSWQQALPPEPTFRSRHLPQSTASSTRGMQHSSRPIVNYPKQGTIFICPPPSSRPSSKDTSWPSQTQMR